jgi:hypothetical protein
MTIHGYPPIRNTSPEQALDAHVNGLANISAVAIPKIATFL